MAEIRQPNKLFAAKGRGVTAHCYRRHDIVRDDPDADLSGLNRDIDNAREISKDEEKDVDAYIGPAAIAEVLRGFAGIRLAKLTDTKNYEKQVTELHAFNTRQTAEKIV